MPAASFSSHQYPERLPFLLVLACSFPFVVGCERSQTQQPHAATPVRVTSVATLAESGGLKYSANIEALTEVTLAFKSGGYVDRIVERKGADGRMRILQVGDRVRQGEVLARVRESEYTDRVNVEKASLDQAQASYEKAKLDFDRASSLYKTDSFTKAQYDAAKAAFDSGTALVESAAASWQQAKTNRSDCALVSPLTGWVLSRNVEVGTLAATGTAAFVLADIHLVKAVFGVPDTRVSYAQLGAAQTITTNSLPGEFRGKITSVSPSADPKSRVFSVEVTIPNPDNKLKPGMIATLVLDASREAQPAIVVPLSSVVRSSQHADGFAVFVVFDQAGRSFAHERSVALGETVGNMISITSGLKTGETIVVTGSTEVKGGDEVKVIP